MVVLLFRLVSELNSFSSLKPPLQAIHFGFSFPQLQNGLKVFSRLWLTGYTSQNFTTRFFLKSTKSNLFAQHYVTKPKANAINL